MMRTDTGNLGDVFVAHSNSNEIAVIDLRLPKQPKKISHRELNNSVDALARGLVKAGLKTGDRVGILSLNRIEYLEVLFGAMRAGCVPVMINTKLPTDQVRYIAKDSEVQIVFCEASLRDLCARQTRCIVFGEDGENGYLDFKDAGAFESFVPSVQDIAEQPYLSLIHI